MIWLAKRTWISYKDFSRGPDIIPIQNPTSTISMTLVSLTFTVSGYEARANFVLSEHALIKYLSP